MSQSILLVASQNSQVMHQRSRTPLVPASILHRISDSSAGHPNQQTGVRGRDHYDRLLQQNLSLAKENARLKRSYRELMERKLQLEASHATRKIAAPAVSDEHEGKQQFLLDVEGKFAKICDEISEAQTKLSKLVHKHPAPAGRPEVTSSSDHTPAADNRQVPALKTPAVFAAKKKKADPETRTMAELQSKENVDPGTRSSTSATMTMTMAPKKKKLSKTGLTERSSTCRIGNMIVKRNSWNLAFESVKPAFRQQTRPDLQTPSSNSVYDFD